MWSEVPSLPRRMPLWLHTNGPVPCKLIFEGRSEKTKTRWTKISNQKQFSYSDLQASFAMSIGLLTNKIQLIFPCKYNTNCLLFM